MSKLLPQKHMEELLSKMIPEGLPPVPPPKIEKDKRHGVLAGDPMSPYPIPSTPAVYRNIAEVMNKKQFICFYPESYTPVPDYFTKNGIVPYYNPPEETDYARGALTVAGMVELTKMNAPFALNYESDIDEVISIATVYIRSMEPYMGDNRVSSYVQGVKRFIEVAEKSRTRILGRQGKINDHTIDIGAIMRKIFARRR